MVGRQDLDRAAVDLAADILDGHLHGLDLAGREIAINAREAVHHRDLQRARRLCLRNRSKANGRQAKRGRDNARISESVSNFHTLVLPNAAKAAEARNLASALHGRQCWTAARTSV